LVPSDGRTPEQLLARKLLDRARECGPLATCALRREATGRIELDLTPKRSKDYEQIIRSYGQERFDPMWWYVPRGSLDRLRRLVADGRADDFIEVRLWAG
jgi:hypothetical protein